MADSQSASSNAQSDGGSGDPGSRRPSGFRNLMRGLLGRNGESQLRDSFEELLEQHDDRETPIDPDERALIENILKVGARTAYDVMVPRADIVSVPLHTALEELVSIMTRQPHSRYPVHGEDLDNTLGMVHIKDVLAATTRPKGSFAIKSVMRKVLFVAPSMRALDLLLQMRTNRQHMALVVDEHGGVDGLITIEDLVEEIVGDIEDEHDLDNRPRIEKRADGSWVADARYDIEDLEADLGSILSDAEREEDIDTLGGLVFTLAGRVPIRGEVISHDTSGFEFEVLEADPRRIKRVRLRRSAVGTGYDAVSDTESNPESSETGIPAIQKSAAE